MLHRQEALERNKQQAMPLMSIPRVAEFENGADAVVWLVGKAARPFILGVVAADVGDYHSMLKAGGLARRCQVMV